MPRSEPAFTSSPAQRRPMLRSGELSSQGADRMLSRPMLFLGVLVAAVVVPYVMLDDNLSKTARAQWARIVGNVEKETDELTAVMHKFGGGAPSITPASSGSAPVAIEQAFRFDVSPQWVAG